MNEITKEKSSQMQIMKNKIQNLKKRKYNLKSKNILMSSYKNQKQFFLRRPYSNYIQRNNNILEQAKTNLSNIKNNGSQIFARKILVNKKISTNDINENTSISFFNNSQRKIKNYIYYEDQKDQNKMNKSRIKFYDAKKIPKSAKNKLKISKSFLGDNVNFSQINIKEEPKGIRGSISPLNYSYRNKYSDITNELFYSGKKHNKDYRSINSPSTTNNSNFNDNNSYSSHFLFGKSLMNSNIFSKIVNNNFFSENKFTNNKNNKIYKSSEENTKITNSYENHINKLLLKKEKSLKNREPSHKSLQKNHQKNQKDALIKFPININSKNKIMKDSFTSMKFDITNISKNEINPVKKIERKKEQKERKQKERKQNKEKNSNEKLNLIIKYAFLSKAIQDIRRKVDFVNPKNGEQILLNTTNIQKNNNNIYQNKKEDFTIVGHEISPTEVYDLFQKELKKKEIIKIKKEKNNNDIYNNRENEEKKISPKFLFKQQYESKSKTKNYRKIEIKKLNNKKQKSVGETLEYIQKKKDASFSINDLLGESTNKNKINYNLITKNDKEAGKKLWSKINTKSSINIFPFKKEKIKSNIIPKIKKRIKSAKINPQKKQMIPPKENNIFVKRKSKKNYTHKIDTLEQHKIFRNKKGFDEIKKDDDNIYDIEFRITDENEGEEMCTINEIMDKKEEKEKGFETNETFKSNNNNRNSNRKRNTIIDLNPFNNKLYKLKKNNLILDTYKNKINNTQNKIEFKQEKTTTNKNTTNNENKRIKNPKQKNIFNKKQKINKITKNKSIKQKTKVSSLELKKQKTEQDSIKILKDNSMELNNKIWNELYSSIDSEFDEFNYNLSCENEYDIKIENVIKKPQKRRSTLLFDRFFRNFKINYKEDETMKKYFNDIFNKYDVNEEELIDIKFFGYDLKIKRKNQINFIKILLKKIKEREALKKENKLINTKLSLILDRFNKNKIKVYNKNFDMNNASSILYRRQRRKSKLISLKQAEKNKTKNNKNLEQEIIEEKNEEFQSQLFLGVKMKSINELEKKKDEILNLIEEKIKDRVMKGDMGRAEMRQFLDFQKRMNSYQIDPNNQNSFVQLLEQEFISFQEQIRLYEEKLKEEKRLNKFINKLNEDIERNFYYKFFQKKNFCNVIDYNEKNNIGLLSPTKEIH